MSVNKGSGKPFSNSSKAVDESLTNDKTISPEKSSVTNELKTRIDKPPEIKSIGTIEEPDHILSR